MTTRTIKLSTPIKRGDTEITDIVLTKPKSGALRGLQITTLQMGDVNALAKLLPRITEPKLNENDIDAMEPEDLAEFADEVAGFLMNSATREFLKASTS
ncbi:phage tail assembly protein [Asticcacaulis sp. BYS171W]|uniref:Phage tail assembly protein n=1 Tax=Asticcacaulis aquaticus TaxID=2984212 RepID=A0ABT5HT75_9CAUL|nr:phage tail assembly protein [Asticcacaulis aquaticus]